MVLTKSELVALLESGVRIFLYLAGKVTPEMHDYRPSSGNGACWNSCATTA